MLFVARLRVRIAFPRSCFWRWGFSPETATATWLRALAMSFVILAGTGRHTAGSSVEVTSRQVTASKPATGWNTQPLLGSHESAVHGSPSSQVISGVEQVPLSGAQTPALWQASGAVQTTGRPRQIPDAQESASVHAAPSSQTTPSGSGAGVHSPASSLQMPRLHWSEAPEQSRGAPPQTPAAQASLTVQKTPSSQVVPSG